MVTPEFLREIERHGWAIKSVDQSGCLARCGTGGCGLTIKLEPGAPIPPRNVPSGPSQLILTDGYDDARRALKARRQDLCLSITEVEEGAGLGHDHLAKAERTDYTRAPNIELFYFWSAFLGYRVALLPTPVPPIAARIIAENRGQVPARQRRNALERRREVGSGG